MDSRGAGSRRWKRTEGSGKAETVGIIIFLRFLTKRFRHIRGIFRDSKQFGIFSDSEKGIDFVRKIQYTTIALKKRLYHAAGSGAVW